MNKLIFIVLVFCTFGCSSVSVEEPLKADIVEPEKNTDLQQDNTSALIENSGLLEDVRAGVAIDPDEVEKTLRKMLARLVRSADDVSGEQGGWVNETYTVKRGDTLSEIVEAAVVGTDIRPEFVLDAIVKVNPTAFIRSNPHWMLAGKKLKFPTPDDFTKLVFLDSKEPKVSPEESDPYLGWIQYP